MGRDLYNKPASTLMFQSTRPHGARLQEHGERRGDLAVSIHAPAWGATRFVGAIHIGTRVSIHAPAWGATLKLPALDVITESFNPRARMGRDHPAVSCEVKRGFNPRARMGRDGQGAICTAVLTGFNPRARMGRDKDPAASGCRSRVSIHAPAWGATHAMPYRSGNLSRFNPRARMGRDPGLLIPFR